MLHLLLWIKGLVCNVVTKPSVVRSSAPPPVPQSGIARCMTEMVQPDEAVPEGFYLLAVSYLHVSITCSSEVLPVST
jgi:hypothetical protein